MSREQDVRPGRTSRELFWKPEGKEGSLRLWLRCNHWLVMCVQEDANGDTEAEDETWLEIMSQVTTVEVEGERWEVAGSLEGIYPQPAILRAEDKEWCKAVLVCFRARQTMHQGEEGVLTISREVVSPQDISLVCRDGTTWHV